MRLSVTLAAVWVVSFVGAHSHTPGMPKVFGLAHKDIAALRSGNIFREHVHRVAAQSENRLRARQGGDAQHRCGPDFGCASCDEGYCCSSAGWCGKGSDYCHAPDCLFDYGPGCDANKVPTGGSTLATDRSAKGGQPLGGEGVRSCVTPGTVAITYDDGPYTYTDALLTLLANYSAKATFFITGINLSKGSIDETDAWKSVIKRMDSEGHQVASHTWSHQDLSSITSKQRYDQLIRNEMAFTNILGKFPVYMRPPYSSCDAASRCQKDMAALGYVISSFDLDTDDYNHLTPSGIQIAKDNVYKAMNGKSPATSNFLSVAHDIHQLTAVNLTDYMLDYIQKQNYKMVTLAECLGVTDRTKWYRTPSSGSRTSSTSTFSAPSACVSTSSSSSSSLPPSSAATAISSSTVSRPISSSSVISSQNPSSSITSSTALTSGSASISASYNRASSASAQSSASSVLLSLSSSNPSSMSTGIFSSTIGSSTLSGSSGMVSSSAPVQSSSLSTRASMSSIASSSQPSIASSVVRTSSTSTNMPSSTPSVSTDGSCGGAKSYTCLNSSYGSCCSQYGWCGSSPSHCGTGCNAFFGTCSSSSSSNSSAKPATSSALATGKKVSTDTSCGRVNGYTCTGSTFGTCCSQYGWCGSTSAYCSVRNGCQAGFGVCSML